MRRASNQFALLLCLVGLVGGCKSSDQPPPQDLATDRKLWPDTRGVDEPFGRVCTEPGKECRDKDIDGQPLTCIGIQGGAQGKGYCTKTCTDVGTECFGAPNGQQARCIVESSQGGDAGAGLKYCGFLCKTKTSFWTCPGTMKCGEPGKDGTAICVPGEQGPQLDGGGPVKDKGPQGDFGLLPNSGKICTNKSECAVGDECIDLAYFGGKKRMCASPCTPGNACNVPSAKNASRCYLQVGNNYFCLWFCLYTGKTYECPPGGAFDCVQPSPTEPGQKICVPK